MTLTSDDLQNLAAVLKGGQDRTNSGILDALMKVAVGVCTAGVLWLLNTTTTVSTNVAGINEMDPPLCGSAVISHTEISETDH